MRTRLTLAAAFAFGAAAAPAQAVHTRPNVIVSVREDRNGADIVAVSMDRSDYPPELLRKQIAALGERLGGARGISVARDTFRPGDPSATILKGACGVDGLVEGNRLNVVPLAQAFAGAPAPYTIRRMLVSFDGVSIKPGVTMAYHTAGKGSDLAFVGRSVGSSVEYNVELLSQDPARLVVNEAKNPAQPAAPAKGGPDPTTLALLGLAVVSAGALVYCLILLLGRRTAAKP